MINQGKDKRLLFAAQSCPTLQQFLLGFCQQNRLTTVGKKLGKCNVKCRTDFSKEGIVGTEGSVTAC